MDSSKNWHATKAQYQRLDWSHMRRPQKLTRSEASSLITKSEKIPLAMAFYYYNRAKDSSRMSVAEIKEEAAEYEMSVAEYRAEILPDIRAESREELRDLKKDVREALVSYRGEDVFITEEWIPKSRKQSSNSNNATIDTQNIGCVKALVLISISVVLFTIVVIAFGSLGRNTGSSRQPAAIQSAIVPVKEAPSFDDEVTPLATVDPLTLNIDEMTMSDGVTYREVTFSKITNGKIIVKHSDGAMRIKLEELPDAVRARIATE